MRHRICMALALMIALTLSVCAIADEYETAAPAQEMEREETPVISAGSVDKEVGEEEDADLDEEIEEESEEESPEEEKDPEEQTVIEEQPDEEESEEKDSEEQKPAAEEEPVEEEPTEEESEEEESDAVEEPAEEESEEESEEEPSEEESTEKEPADEEPAEESEEVVVAEPVEELPEAEAPVANDLTYSGEAQALVSAQGAWLYSLDGESYGEDIPTAVDAGEYTVYYKAGEDAEPEALAVTVAKADVTFVPPVAAFIEE